MTVSLMKSRLINLKYYSSYFGLRFTKNARKLAGFSDKHQGERCFIIGNGPSLNDCDLTLLRNEVTFGVNAIYLNHQNMGFHPTYYVVEDVFVAEDRCDEISKYIGPSQKFFGSYLRYTLNGDKKTTWMNVIVDYRDYPGFPNFSKNSSRCLWVGGSVTYLCMQLAYFMGFSTVYLIGFDHNYVVPRDATVSNIKPNGFDILSNSEDPNHFHPDYFGKGYRWHDPKVDRMEKGFLKARQNFEADGRKIYNATKGGRLEAFDRVEYDSLLS
ncbi:6-hydroxymethylpterin diphosphokinase MptE-like protein [Pseudomonadota bacterium]